MMSGPALGDVVVALGPDAIDFEIGLLTRRSVSGLMIDDVWDGRRRPSQDSMVLGVGLQDDDDVGAMLERVGPEASVLLVRLGHRPGPAVMAAADRAGVALIGVSDETSWDQVISVLGSLGADVRSAGDRDKSLAEGDSQDLFALADAISELIGAPVTIEDRLSRVLAFSLRQEEADAPRVESILGRRVPTRITQRYVDGGVFQRLHGSVQPIFISTESSGSDVSAMSRVAVAVRAGDEILGSVWVAVDEQLSADKLRALQEATGPVALAILRVRSGAVAERARRSKLVSEAVSGAHDSTAALEALGLAGQRVAVLELAVWNETEAGGEGGGRSAMNDADQLAERLRLADAFALHLSAASSRAVAAVVGATCLGLLPVGGTSPEESTLRVASRFVDRIGSPGLVVGIGAPALDGRQLMRSREDAARAVRVLRTHGGTRRVGRLADVQVEAFLVELSDEITRRGETLEGPATRLEAHDRIHGTHLVETFSAWLDHFGDIASASRSLFVHPNTFRYRLRSASQVGGIDLADRDARFAAMLHFRLRAHLDEI